MTIEKMTIHNALAELKTLDARIEKAIRETPYVLAVKHSAEKINGMSIADFKTQIKSCYQKATDLIARRDAMKRAVVLSNANTKITIGGNEYTVAEAIEMKNHGIEFKERLLNAMTYAYNDVQNDLSRNSGDSLERKAEQYVLAVIQAQPKDSKMTVDSDAMQSLRKTYIENNTYDLIDPLGVANVIKSLEDEINKFNTEIDAALSCSNALTVIEFEY